jgi:Flp pilus assembly pilin Flp
MFKQLFKNKRAQNTAEYALLIALVVAGIIAMQTYAQRALQGRLHDASGYMTNGKSANQDVLGQTPQYEPYYMNSSYNVARDSFNEKKLAEGTVAYDANSQRQRAGAESTDFNLQKHSANVNATF